LVFILHAPVAGYHLTFRSPAMMDEFRKLWELIDTNNISIRARCGRSAANVWADRPSRKIYTDDWQLNPRIFTYLNSMWAPTPSTSLLRKATRSFPATIPVGETPTPKPWTASIFPTTSG
jgi:hypothetical protein